MSAMDLQQEREGFVYVAKLAEEAKRYDGNASFLIICHGSGFPSLFIFLPADMADAMKKVAKLDVELTVEERNLLSVGYKNVLLARTACCRILSSIEQKEESRGNEQHVCKTREYRQKVESELSNIFNDLMAVIDGHLIPSSPATEASVFYYKM